MTLTTRVLGTTAAAVVASTAVLGQLEIVDWVGSVGFPIAVTAWLLVRMEARLQDQTRAIHRLAQAIEKRLDEKDKGAVG